MKKWPQLTHACLTLVTMEECVSRSKMVSSVSAQRTSLATDVKLSSDTVSLTTLVRMVLYVKIYLKVSQVKVQGQHSIGIAFPASVA